jgi:MFS family permease
MLQGLAIGGEMPGAWVFVAEHVPARRVGFAAASLCSGMSVGILLGSLTALWLHGRFDEHQVLAGAWRLPFLVGGVFGFVAVWLRRWLAETPVFLQMQAERQLVEELPFKRVLRDHPAAVGVSMLATWVLTAAIVVVILMTPTLIQSAFGVPEALAARGNVIAACCPYRYSTSSGCLRVGGGKAASSSARSAAARRSDSAAALARTCPGEPDSGMAMTRPLRIAQASATAGASTPWRAATRASTALPSRARLPSGE